MLVFAPLLEETGRKLEGSELRLAEGDGVEFFAAGEFFEQLLDYFAEGVYAQTDVFVGGGPDDIVVGKVDGRPSSKVSDIVPMYPHLDMARSRMIWLSQYLDEFL